MIDTKHTKNSIPSMQDDIFSHMRGLCTPMSRGCAGRGWACAHPLPADEHVINICFPPLLTVDQQIPVNSLRAQTVAVLRWSSDNSATVA